MEEKYQSEWSEITDERTINDCSAFVRFAKPFRRMFYTAILFAFGLSIINILLPRVIQVFMDNYLTPKTATMQVILTFLLFISLVSLSKVLFGFQWYLYSMASLKRINIYE